MDPIIKVDSISKIYEIGKEVDYNMRSSIGNIFNKKNTKQNFKALDNVSFHVNQGEVLGFIGKNGAGKSTLLKVLSKITAPSTGRIEITGRVASLLEVGTGFHPELTGRENIFLNGTILGMTKKEVSEKLDDIINFAGIRQFIDTPVKRYSSGMYVRLAFAVAAHLDPEILIIDEVLAVGDYEFQKKCLGKMEEVAQAGRTVLFVSHNLAAVRKLCTRAIVLDQGRIAFEGMVNEAIDHYGNNTKNITNEVSLLDNSTIERRKGLQNIKFEKIKYQRQPVKFGHEIDFEVKLKSTEPLAFGDIEIACRITDNNDNCLIHASSKFMGSVMQHENDQDNYRFKIENILKPGFYKQVLFLRNTEGIQDWIVDGLYLEVEDGNPYNFNNTAEISGAILPNFKVLKNHFDES